MSKMTVRVVKSVFTWAVVSIFFNHTVVALTASDKTLTEPPALNNTTSEPTATKACVMDANLINSMSLCMIKSTCLLGECYLNKTVCDIRCTCPPGIEGDRCQTLSQHGQTNSSKPPPITNDTDSPTTTTEVCFANLACVHGTCVDKSWCNCIKGWTGTICSVRCDLDCVRGVCRLLHPDRKMYCNCEWGYIGDLCEMTTPSPYSNVTMETQFESVDQRYIAGVVVGAVVVLFIVAAVMCWVLWRRRARILLKFIYWAKPYEDDDYKLYDAFVSFKSSTSDEIHHSSAEELFVMNTLMSKLETELGFRLCVHFRDFIPGKAIVENVLEAIENSRRTILLLSPSYIENSFWTRFEYEQAQVAAMERKQRIIPIIFEDISDVTIEDITLRHILKSITYIKWPGYDDERKLDDFWERLTLTMPKLLSSKTAPGDDTPTNVNKDEKEIDDSLISKTSISNGPYTSFDKHNDSIVIDMGKTNKVEKDNTIEQEKVEIIDTNANKLLESLRGTYNFCHPQPS